MHNTPILNIDNLSVSFQKGFYLLKLLTYTINHKDFIVILGSNGSGKTTMLKTFNGTIRNYSGHIKLFNQFEIKKLPHKIISKHIGTITQKVEDSLFMEFSLIQNFQMYMEAFNDNTRDIKDFLELLSTINPKLLNLMDTKVGRLSGGERQCFLLCLNLFLKRDLLLLDEHTSALDPKTAHEVMSMTADKVSENNTTCIMTTHSLDDAIKYGNRLIIMQNGQIIQKFDEEEKYKLSKLDLLQYYY
jgi:putative ABC transport system ATP-binding protein